MTFRDDPTLPDLQAPLDIVNFSTVSRVPVEVACLPFCLASSDAFMLFSVFTYMGLVAGIKWLVDTQCKHVGRVCYFLSEQLG